MYESLIIEILRETLMTVMLISGALILIPFVTSLLISIFQAVTQIQEQTLVFLPKFYIILTIILFGGPLIISKLSVLFLRVLSLVSNTLGV